MSDVGIYLRDGPFKTDIRFVYLHPCQGSYWVLYIHECYSDSYGITPPYNVSESIIKPKGNFFFFLKTKDKVWQLKEIFYCAAYCLCISYLTKVFGIDFKSDVLNIYYEIFSLDKWRHGKNNW